MPSTRRLFGRHATIASLTIITLTCFAFSQFTFTAAGQSPSETKNGPGAAAADKSRQSDKRIKVDVDLVLVNTTVTDPYNRLVTGLERENFRVFEDNDEQELVHFSSEDSPISIGVILDMSGSSP